MTVAARPIRVGLFLLVLAVVTLDLRGQDAFDKDAFLSRKKWYVTFTFSLKGRGSATRTDGNDHYTTNWNIRREVTGTFELDHVAQFGPRSSVLARGERYQGRYVSWDASVGLSSVNYIVADLVDHESVEHTAAEIDVSGYTELIGQGSTQIGRFKELKCDLKDMVFDFVLDGLSGWSREPNVKPLKLSGEYHGFTPITKVREDIKYPLEEFGIFGALPELGPLRNQLDARKLELAGDRIVINVSMPVIALPSFPSHSGSIPGGREKFNDFTTAGGEPLELSLDVVISPGPATRAKLILKPHDYGTWRPQCSNSEEKPGNKFEVDWRVEEEGGDSATPTKIQRVEFSLLKTSREPGVCLNFPLHPKTPADFDLKFQPARNAPGGYDVAPDGQRLTLSEASVSAGKGSVAIDCFDAGAWSELSVVAELDDGRRITGHLEGDPSAITIPKRKGGSLIADVWKAEHGISAADNDDSEKSPAPGKPAGDGFTLYEEYRGFFENGKHVEGDPNKIDFFVRNYIGGDARPGIDLFAGLTNAAVHDRLSDGEFDPAKRVMNANHQQGPHRVDQHGVFLRTQAGLNGAEARFTTEGTRGRPKLCTGIFVQPRGAQTTTATSENLPASDIIFLYDQFIAHEMLHAVGVEHHGQRDYHMSLWLMLSDTPGNTRGKPYFEVSGKIVTITDEASGRDLAAKLEPDLLLAREKFRPIVARFMDSKSPAEFEIILNLFVGTYNWYVGAQHGECSGVEGCLSRYYFAKLYEKKGVANAYYYISHKQTERAGLALCRSREGTGINAPGRKPQSRYGDTNPGWGDCADWIVFNDAAPLEPAPKP